MRVAVFHNLPSGGARRALIEMTRQLLAAGHAVDLFMTSTADEELLPSRLPGAGARVWRTEPWEGFGATGRLRRATRIVDFLRAMRVANRVQREIAGVMNDGGYDLAFVHHDRVMQAPALLRFLTLPTVYYCQEPIRAAYEHDLLPGSMLERAAMYFPKIGLRDRDRESARSADSVLVNSTYSKESILRAYGIEAEVMYLGVDVDVFSPGDVPREAFVLSVGALHPQKGHRLAVEALGSVPLARRPSLVVVGDRGIPGEAEHLAALAGAHGVELRIATRVAEPELVDLYRRARLLLCFQRLEPFGLVALEAGACGTPTVAIREAGLRESVIDDVTGVLVDRRDAAELGDTVDRLLSSPDEWQRLSGSAVEAIRGAWTWQHTAARLEQHFADLLAKR